MDLGSVILNEVAQTQKFKVAPSVGMQMVTLNGCVYVRKDVSMGIDHESRWESMGGRAGDVEKGGSKRTGDMKWGMKGYWAGDV